MTERRGDSGVCEILGATLSSVPRARRGSMRGGGCAGARVNGRFYAKQSFGRLDLAQVGGVVLYSGKEMRTNSATTGATDAVAGELQR